MSIQGWMQIMECFRCDCESISQQWYGGWSLIKLEDPSFFFFIWEDQWNAAEAITSFVQRLMCQVLHASISILVSCDYFWRTEFWFVNNIVGKEEICAGANAKTARYYERKNMSLCSKSNSFWNISYVSTYLYPPIWGHYYNQGKGTRFLNMIWQWYIYAIWVELFTLRWISYLFF